MILKVHGIEVDELGQFWCRKVNNIDILVYLEKMYLGVRTGYTRHRGDYKGVPPYYT